MLGDPAGHAQTALRLGRDGRNAASFPQSTPRMLSVPSTRCCTVGLLWWATTLRRMDAMMSALFSPPCAPGCASRLH
jgi:hypothetical protein